MPLICPIIYNNRYLFLVYFKNENQQKNLYKMKKFLSIALFLMLPAYALMAQVITPTMTAKMFVTTDTKIDEETTSYSGNAPMTARFEAIVENPDDVEINYEWRLTRQNNKELIFSRAESQTEFTFMESGAFLMELRWSYRDNGELIEGVSPSPFSISINESHMEVPNAFTPNGDGTNETFHVKEGYQSIVSFHATVYNRQMKKVYSWDNIAEGWDGRSGGHECPDGAYYLVINAKGADGREYKIKKTINLLRKFDATAGSTR